MIARLLLSSVALVPFLDVQGAALVGALRSAAVPSELSPLLARMLTNMDAPLLVHATKAENVRAMLQLAQRERHLDPIDALRYARLYNDIDGGDALLLACLKHTSCQLQEFSRIAVASPLHREVVQRQPTLGWVQANHAVGALTERVMHRFFTSSGWEAVPGEIGRQGIDGLFVKRRGELVSDVLVVESKYNTSALQDTLSGTQMSDIWIRAKVDALQTKFPNSSDYAQIRRIVDAGSYRGILWKLGASDGAVNVSLQRVVSRDTSVKLDSIQGKDTLLPFAGSPHALMPAETDWQFPNLIRRWLQEETDFMFPHASTH